MSDSPSAHRSWQFSIRTLLVLMLIAASFSAGWTIAIRRARIAEYRALREAEHNRRVAEEAAVQARRAEAALADAKAQAESAARAAARLCELKQAIRDMGEVSNIRIEQIEGLGVFRVLGTKENVDRVRKALEVLTREGLTWPPTDDSTVTKDELQKRQTELLEVLESHSAPESGRRSWPERLEQRVEFFRRLQEVRGEPNGENPRSPGGQGL